MRAVVYLIADVYGVHRLTKRAPDLGRTDIAIKLSVTIPDSCFRGPMITTAIEVAPEHVIQPPVLEIEVLDAPA
jgi:hypothetical protein